MKVFFKYRAACVFATGLTLVVCVADLSSRNEANQSLSTGVIDLVISSKPANEDDRMFCRGVHIGEGKVITAGHCLPSANVEITVKCGDTSTTEQLERFERHDEADIVWGQLPAALKCPITKVDLSEVSGVSSIWLAARYKKEIVQILYEDPFTFQGRQTENCLDRGDSGAPAFVEPPDQQGISPAVGILISGQPDCPAWQTVLKFSAVADWLAEVLLPKRRL